MEVMIRISALAIISSILILLLKKNSPDISFMLMLGACSLIIYFAAEMIRNVISLVQELAGISGAASAVPAVMLKTAGIAIIAKFTADLCKDAGQQSAASAVEFVGCAAAIYISIPLMNTMLEMIDALW